MAAALWHNSNVCCCRWRLGSCLACLSLVILLLQVVIHPVILQLFTERQQPSHESSPTTSSSPTSRRTQQQQQQQQRLMLMHSSSSSSFTNRKPDGYFNNIPIYLNDGSIPRYSKVHCVGETHHIETAWMYRSCHFTHFCFDTNSSDFVILRSPVETLFSEQRNTMNQDELDGIYLSNSLLSSSTSLSSSNMIPSNNIYNNLQVALGGINPRWTTSGKGHHDKGIHKMKWSPRVLDATISNSAGDGAGGAGGAGVPFYELPDHVVLIPFHSFAAHNIGHLLWDDFLPIFTLLHMFDLVDDETSSQLQQQQQQQQQQHHQYLLLRKVLKHAMYASCDKRPKTEKGCQTNLERFLPAMGIDPKTFSTTKQYQLKLLPDNSAHPSSSLICAKQGVAGIGMLTDHGLVDHGWVHSDTKHPHNHGRAPLLAKFRNYLVQNLGFDTAAADTNNINNDNNNNNKASSKPPFQIVFSTNSSRNPARQLLFHEQIHAVQNAFSSSSSSSDRLVLIQNLTLSQWSLTDQVKLAIQTSVFVTACGGGAVTATFLPKGATLIVYYPERGGFHFATSNYTGSTPALLDWDLFNNMAHLHVHWFPIGTMNTKASLDTLIHVLRLESKLEDR